MRIVTDIARAQFAIGDLVDHRLFEYRGVIVDVDQNFESTEEWYELVAKSRPPKDKPWYHVLVHESMRSTYVAERNLELDESAIPIKHPMLDHFFSRFEDGRYISNERTN
jgi:heat shock protein HspQ